MARGTVVAVIFGLALAAGARAAAAPPEFEAGRDAWRRGDVRAAVSHLRISADAGYAPAQALLGEVLDRAEQNEEAVRYYRMAAAQGDPEGLYGLAVMVNSGEGTPRDPRQAREAMTRAATLGHKPAVTALAMSYLQGGFDIGAAERDGPEARRWIEAAASQDLLAALDRLALAYRKGELGLAVDEKKALELEARAKAIRGERGKITKKKAR